MFNLIKKAAASTHTIQQESSTVLEDFSEEFEKQLTKAKEAERNHPPEDERKRLENHFFDAIFIGYLATTEPADPKHSRGQHQYPP